MSQQPQLSARLRGEGWTQENLHHSTQDPWQIDPATAGNFANFNDIKNTLEKAADIVHAMVDTG